MRATGIVRKLDNLGRVALPIELRRTLTIKKDEPFEIFVDNENIVLKKYSPDLACKVKGEVSEDNLILAKGKLILSREGVKQLLRELEVKL
ncbi:transition state regulator Abh [Priestia aryabhattai]|uniref:AbrB/MazE/SpoVT family DNA-binding domain-containing protein n=1 Tax=Priestia aryabhattai TaxID=412384 RepID=UPI001C0AA235|nr:AbrB/MazE/SpoVT family DNA-binding domain-containing protein [Priestia aryabhattai]MBU3574140.1 transition state regulator Abh [Priestia aryabhattai]